MSTDYIIVHEAEVVECTPHPSVKHLPRVHMPKPVLLQAVLWDDGNILLYLLDRDGALLYDFWYDSYSDLKKDASLWYGVAPDSWRDV